VGHCYLPEIVREFGIAVEMAFQLQTPTGVEFVGRTPRCRHPLGQQNHRDVAQPGSALAWGARGREFKSRRPDQFV
jgi:hypothetical protein